MELKTFQSGLSNRNLNDTAASLLGFLLTEPKSGWDIVQDVEASIGYFWNLTRSQVYRELRSLGEAGLVEVGETGARDRRPYAITDAGREAFFAWLKKEPGLDIVRMQGLLKFFFGDYLDEDTLKRFVTVQKIKHERHLAYFKEILPAVEAEHPICGHTLRFGIRHEEAMLEWLDELPLVAARANSSP